MKVITKNYFNDDIPEYIKKKIDEIDKIFKRRVREKESDPIPYLVGQLRSQLAWGDDAFKYVNTYIAYYADLYSQYISQTELIEQIEEINRGWYPSYKKIFKELLYPTSEMVHQMQIELENELKYFKKQETIDYFVYHAMNDFLKNHLIARVYFPDANQKYEIKSITKGDWIDLQAAETVELKQGEIKLISLGFSMQIPPRYEAIVAPRSSTAKKYGVLMANSIGIIDNSYSGPNDIWKFAAYATRDTKIEKGTRICQFRLFKNQTPLSFYEADHVDGDDRGGFGSTGN